MSSEALTAEERARLCRLIAVAQEEAEHHYRQRQRLADCVAAVICRQLGEREEAVHARAGQCGTQQAVLLTYWSAAFGVDARPEPLVLECALDIVAALGRRRLGPC